MTPKLKSVGASLALGFAVFIALGDAVKAHEFWLEPETFTPALSQVVPISIRVGQKFKGDSFPYIKSEYKQFVLSDAAGQSAVKGVDGDDPALSQRFAKPGLAALVHYSTPEKLTFETWEKFTAYLDLEGLRTISERHLARKLPQSNIRETYSRCAKLLVNVGPGASGEDRLSGLMPFELVAESNPYALHAGDTITLRLYLNGKPQSDTQIVAISRGHAERRLTARTDEEGRARIMLDDSGPWLFNAVHMFEPGQGVAADWESLWASMTFALPK